MCAVTVPLLSWWVLQRLMVSLRLQVSKIYMCISAAILKKKKGKKKLKRPSFWLLSKAWNVPCLHFEGSESRRQREKAKFENAMISEVWHMLFLRGGLAAGAARWVQKAGGEPGALRVLLSTAQIGSEPFWCSCAASHSRLLRFVCRRCNK